ncbi:alpha/beta hydrolase [Actinoplanes sp. NPDC024001]|uniref:alpha/beta fold hydrolase n=1 Tax=Actinoplanes sp. NPDC024001 TaxID=3154598 RepID=UPI0033DB2E59
MTAMTRWRTATADIAYTDSGGDGETLLLMHGGGLADWFTPLAGDPVLKRHRVIRLVRAGYTGAPAPHGLTIADHAEHAASLLSQLGATPAHVVAHSSAAAVALQLAIDNPAAVRTLSLCEPPLVDALADPADLELLHAQFGPVMGAVMAATARGDAPAAFDAFMTLVCGPDYRRVMTGALGPAVVEEAMNNSRYFLTEEAAALTAWTVAPAALARLSPPVLLVQGSASPPPTHRLIAHLAGLIPGSTIATIAHANHLMPLSDPAELGRVIGDFCRSAPQRQAVA